MATRPALGQLFERQRLVESPVLRGFVALALLVMIRSLWLRHEEGRTWQSLFPDVVIDILSLLPFLISAVKVKHTASEIIIERFLLKTIRIKKDEIVKVSALPVSVAMRIKCSFFWFSSKSEIFWTGRKAIRLDLRSGESFTLSLKKFELAKDQIL